MAPASAQVTSTTGISHSLMQMRKNFKMRYFGEVAGPNLQKWDDNQYDYKGNKTRTPTNLYNIFNIQYKVAPSTSLLVGPRFAAQIGDRNELKQNEDQHTMVIDDWQFGIVQEIFRNKNITYNGRLTHRHPFSTASRNSRIDSQIEYQNDLFIRFTPAISLLQWNTYRYYVYEAQKNEERYRINFTSILNYEFNDIWKMQVFHDWDLQHRAPKYGNKFKNKHRWNYFEKYRNQLALGLGYSPSPKMTFIPFIKALNDENWSMETTQLGLWVLGKVF